MNDELRAQATRDLAAALCPHTDCAHENTYSCSGWAGAVDALDWLLSPEGVAAAALVLNAHCEQVGWEHPDAPPLGIATFNPLHRQGHIDGYQHMGHNGAEKCTPVYRPSPAVAEHLSGIAAHENAE